MQSSALYRSRGELSNAYFVAKFGFDIAEIEPFQVAEFAQGGRPGAPGAPGADPASPRRIPASDALFCHIYTVGSGK